MDIFEIINKNRIEHGYIHKNLQQYKRFCNKVFKELKKKQDASSLIYKLESNMAKFFIFDSLRYLHKNIRLLNNTSSGFKEAYLKYIMCYLNNKKSPVSIETLIELHHELADYYSFLDDIYTLSDNRHDFDQYKMHYKWHDIPLVFETQKLLDEFLACTFTLEDHRFHTQLSLKISRVERSKADFLSFLVNENRHQVGILQLFNKSRTLSTFTFELKRFLEDNFIDSAYVEQMHSAVHLVHGFITKLFEYQNGAVEFSENIQQFKIPEFFAEHKKAFEILRNEKIVDKAKLRSLLLNLIEERIVTNVDDRKIPFLPIFYDLAYSFIVYPQEEGTDILTSLKNFSFF